MTFTLFSLPWGSWKRALCPLTLVPQGLNYIPYLLNRRRERKRIQPTTSHIPPTQITNPNSQQHLLRPYIPDGPLSRFIQTPSRSSLSSPQVPPHLLDSQPFALWPPHIWNLLLGSPTPPDSKSTNNSPWAHLLICIEQTCPSSGLQPVSSSHSLLFTVCLLCLPPLSAF